MEEIKLENVTLSLSSESNNVLVKSPDENVILSNQVVEVVSDLIKNNFNIVNNHYKKMIDIQDEQIDFKDIVLLSIKIVLHYIYMYNSWITTHHKQEKIDLQFNEKDFNNPSTHDILFGFFKKKYPNDWGKKCAILLGMTLNELKTYYSTRKDFYDK